MADISREIQAFKSAVYGEDVRDAMVSAMNKINTVNEDGVAVIESQVQIDEAPTSYTKLKLETTGTDIEVLTADEINKDIINIMKEFATYISRTVGGVTFTWNALNTVCTVSGTATGNAYTNIRNDSSSLPSQLEAGKTYNVKFKTTDENLYLEFLIYKDGATSGGQSVTFTGDSILILPSNATGLNIRLRVRNGTTVNAVASDISITSAYTNEELTFSKLHVYNTISELISDKTINDGLVVYANGYYTKGDGGDGFFKITQTKTNDYDLELANGLYAEYIPTNGFVNAGAFGNVGENAGTGQVNKAIACAVNNNANLCFPVDITIGGTIVIPKELNGKLVVFNGDVTYTGTVCAIRLHNTKNVTVKGKKITALNAIGLQYLQNESYTLYNTNAEFNFIEASSGIRVTASTWGILECDIHADRIICDSNCLRCECLQESTEKDSFIGQMKFKIQHALSRNGYALNFNASISPSTITGILIDGISLESSANGIMLRGDCKLIKILNIRCLEQDSFSYFINASGDLRYDEFTFTSPVPRNKLTISTTYGISTKPVVIGGGIYSPTSFRYADEMIVASGVTTYKSTAPLVRTNGGDFTFEDSENTSSYRCYNYLINDSGETINYHDLKYFSPFGVNELFIKQNKTNGSIIKVYSGTRVIFDGESVSDEGETMYMIKTFYNSSSGTNEYAVMKP